MEDVPILLACPHCGATNRVPPARLRETPQCGRCHQALFAGEERMALVAELDGDRPLRGMGDERVPTGAANAGLHVVGVNVGLHSFSSVLPEFVTSKWNNRRLFPTVGDLGDLVEERGVLG